MNTLELPGDEWLRNLFEMELCAECGGDAEDHDAVGLNGNWFARCKYPVPCTPCLVNRERTIPARFLAPQIGKEHATYSYTPVCAECYGVPPDDLKSPDALQKARENWWHDHAEQAVPEVPFQQPP